MADSNEIFGPSPYGHKLTDIFLDVDRGVINYEYFQPYFEQVALPLDVAKVCLGEHYSQYRAPVQVEFVKFVKLSTLRSRPRIPSYQEISTELVDFKDISHFKLVGHLRAFGGEDVFSKTPCVFVSHRWQSVEHPDPSGTRLGQILERFDAIQRASETAIAGGLPVDRFLLSAAAGEADNCLKRISSGCVAGSDGWRRLSKAATCSCSIRRTISAAPGVMQRFSSGLQRWPKLVSPIT